jgi:hypothetical protein
MKFSQVNTFFILGNCNNGFNVFPWIYVTVGNSYQCTYSTVFPLTPVQIVSQYGMPFNTLKTATVSGMAVENIQQCNCSDSLHMYHGKSYMYFLQHFNNTALSWISTQNQKLDP